MNAANEEAVFSFLEGRIKLFNIIECVEKVLEKHSSINNPTLEEILAVDNETRALTQELIQSNF